MGLGLSGDAKGRLSRSATDTGGPIVCVQKGTSRIWVRLERRMTKCGFENVALTADDPVGLKSDLKVTLNTTQLSFWTI